MLNFKASVVKDNKRFNLVIKSNNINEARALLHKEGYAVQQIDETGEVKLEGNKFFFTIMTKSGLKNGTIIGKDIFSLYIKLVDDLSYDVKYLYDKESLGTLEKERIIGSLKEEYLIYSEQLNKKNKKSIDKEKIVKLKEEKKFFANKELDKIKKLNDITLSKLKDILNSKKDLDYYEKNKFQESYNSLLKVQNITNIVKVKKIGEEALTLIGELELNTLEENKNEENAKLLKNTNNLLKALGSSINFIEEDKDINKILSKKVEDLKKFYFTLFEKKEKKEKVDTLSYTYIKTMVSLKKYENRLKDNNKEKLKNIGIFLFKTKENEELRNTLTIKSKVLKQNIDLLKIRVSGKKFSYTKIEKGYNFLNLKIMVLLNVFKNPIFYLIIIYTFLLMLFLIVSYYTGFDYLFNFTGIKILLHLIFILFFIKLSKGMISLSLNFAFYIFIFIFTIVNF